MGTTKETRKTFLVHCVFVSSLVGTTDIRRERDIGQCHVTYKTETTGYRTRPGKSTAPMT